MLKDVMERYPGEYDLSSVDGGMEGLNQLDKEMAEQQR
jgi:hypothetical protein